MDIRNCTPEDLEAIQQLYTAARNLQAERKMVVWPAFDNPFIKNEIAEKRHWKIVADGVLVCNWVITYTDPSIWGDRDRNDAVFIHRICTHPAYRGNRYIDAITTWARAHAAQLGRRYVRLDTLGNNQKLVRHYTAAGFTFLGIVTLTDTRQLPLHYQLEPHCCLFEITV
ncbi:GNAT family N-acetyltransferase [Niabella beijingensis]|uniref:GNAT family N-acetyltransferase n=1 Tax=Niabella beijingensis TaxID=2872700 RepID=UPI001CBC7B5A|nr:GNAT family N-acetyltransferase [Niabella beijingensis]MBZ4191800.1 GNAT family N-acetyltransferase [Niabella beijingensis]